MFLAQGHLKRPDLDGPHEQLLVGQSPRNCAASSLASPLQLGWPGHFCMKLMQIGFPWQGHRQLAAHGLLGQEIWHWAAGHLARKADMYCPGPGDRQLEAAGHHYQAGKDFESAVRLLLQHPGTQQRAIDVARSSRHSAAAGLVAQHLLEQQSFQVSFFRLAIHLELSQCGCVEQDSIASIATRSLLAWLQSICRSS